MRANIKKESLLSQDYLKKIMNYNPLTGVFTWLERPVELFNPGKSQRRICNTWNSRYANKNAGHIWTPKEAKTSYLSICFSLNGKTNLYLAHRLAILFTDGNFPAESVDHIDGNGLNNARINLREVTALENHKNYPMSSNNTSGCVGVCWHKRDQKWMVSICINEKRIHGGCFADKEDAIARRKKMEIEYNFHINHGREKEN